MQIFMFRLVLQNYKLSGSVMLVTKIWMEAIIFSYFGKLLKVRRIIFSGGIKVKSSSYHHHITIDWYQGATYEMCIYIITWAPSSGLVRLTILNFIDFEKHTLLPSKCAEVPTASTNKNILGNLSRMLIGYKSPHSRHQRSSWDTFWVMFTV